MESLDSDPSCPYAPNPLRTVGPGSATFAVVCAGPPRYSRQGCSSVGRRRCHTVLVLDQRLTSQANGFGDGGLLDIATPRFDNRAPSHALRNLFQHVLHENPGAAEGQLAVADFRVHDNVPAKNFTHRDISGVPSVPQNQSRQPSWIA